MCDQTLDIGFAGHKHLVGTGVDVLLAKEGSKGVGSLHRVGGSQFDVAPLISLNQREA